MALAGIPKDEALRLIKDLESQMRAAAKQLEFEKAAQLRDRIRALKDKDLSGLFSADTDTAAPAADAAG